MSRNYHNSLLNRFKGKNYEQEETEVANTYYILEDNVLEISSCLEYVTSLLSRKCKHVNTIEANPELKESLGTTIRVNKYISKTPGKVVFQTYDNIVAGPDDRQDGEMNNVRGCGDSLKTYDVDTIELIDIDGIENINVMMLDMEGGEYNFLKTYIGFIRRNIKKICLELHGHQMKTKDFNKKCIKILTDVGYKIVFKKTNVYYFVKQI